MGCHPRMSRKARQGRSSVFEPQTVVRFIVNVLRVKIGATGLGFRLSIAGSLRSKLRFT